MPSHQMKKKGLAPGTPVYTGELVDQGLKVWVIDYSAEAIAEHEPHDFAALRELRETDSVTWVNLVGLSNVDAIQQVCKAFGVHPLAVEDIVSVHGRPKTEAYPDQLFVVAKMVTLRPGTDSTEPEVHAEHVSMVIGSRFVLTFQEREGDVLDPVRQRLREGRPRLRAAGTDFLAIVLLDALVDHTATVVEQLGQAAESLEDEVLMRTDREHLPRIYVLRRELKELRRWVWPLRDMIAGLQRSEAISQGTRPFLRDLQDHVLQAVDTLDSYRDMVMGMVDLHMTGVSNETNEVMRLLTVIGSIFIPLTFIAGVYGMNFTNMPELSWTWGYAAVWAVMFATALVMLVFFRRRGWL